MVQLLSQEEEVVCCPAEMALLSPEEVSAVKSRLSGWSSKPPGRGGKTETQAAQLKEQGNKHFKRKKNLQALQCYSEVV